MNPACGRNRWLNLLGPQVGLAERCSVESLDPRVELAGIGRKASETTSVVLGNEVAGGDDGRIAGREGACAG